LCLSDGGTNDSSAAANIFAVLNQELKNSSGLDIELHAIGFGGGANTTQLQQIARASTNGNYSYDVIILEVMTW